MLFQPAVCGERVIWVVTSPNSEWWATDKSGMLMLVDMLEHEIAPDVFDCRDHTGNVMVTKETVWGCWEGIKKLD